MRFLIEKTESELQKEKAQNELLRELSITPFDNQNIVSVESLMNLYGLTNEQGEALMNYIASIGIVEVFKVYTIKSKEKFLESLKILTK